MLYVDFYKLSHSARLGLNSEVFFGYDQMWVKALSSLEAKFLWTLIYKNRRFEKDYCLSSWYLKLRQHE